MRKTSENIKAVLRIPRLCREFHKRMQSDQIGDYEVLDRVFSKHYDKLENDLYTPLGYSSNEEAQPFERRMDEIEEMDRKRNKLSIVEQHIIESNNGSPDRFDQRSINSSLDYQKAMIR